MSTTPTQGQSSLGAGQPVVVATAPVSAPTPGPASPTLPGALAEVEVIGAAILGAGATITATVKEFGNTALNTDTAIALAVLGTVLLVVRTIMANIGTANNQSPPLA